jgi:hypothetical protein
VKTAGFWTKDWFLGLAVAIVLFLFAGSDLIQSLERKAYDMGVRATDRTPSDRIAVIATPDILQFNPQLAPALVAFLDRTMAKGADERFQTGAEFAHALRACMGTEKLEVDITI